MKPLPSRTSRNAASSRGISGSYSARTSTRGIVCTRGHFSHSDPTVDPIRDAYKDHEHDRVLDVTEVVLEALVARAEAVADADEGERPDRRPDERQAEEQRERHLEQPGRDRDERADDGQERPDQDTRLAPTPEPRVGPVEPFRRDVEPTAVALEQLAAAPASDQPADDAAEEIAERRRDDDREVGAGSRSEVGAEDRDPVGSGEDSGGDGAAHERDELTPDGKERAEREQAEDGVDAVVCDRGGEAGGNAREEHPGESSDACERAMRTAPRASSCRPSSSPARP